MALADSSGELKHQEVLVAGLVRNGARSLAKNVAILRKAVGGLFGQVHTLLVESDSKDRTEDVLAGLTRDLADFRYLCLGNLRDAHPVRCDRLARCRNTFLDELRENPIYSKVRYLIVSDMDGVSRHLTTRALATCWERDAPWDVCTANQGDYYYDVWTLRHDPWCPGDTWQEFERLKPLVGKRAATEIALFSRMIHVSTMRPMIEVESAFGGLAVYKREAVLAGRYGGLREDGTEVCEHVTLCTEMRAKGFRIFLNPALINAKTTDHAGRKKFFRTFRRNLWGYLSGKD